MAIAWLRQLLALAREGLNSNALVEADTRLLLKVS